MLSPDSLDELPGSSEQMGLHPEDVFPFPLQNEGSCRENLPGLTSNTFILGLRSALIGAVASS